MTSTKEDIRKKEAEVDPSRPALAGFSVLGQEFLSHSAIPVKRENIDWETVCYDGWGWTTTNELTGVTHKGQQKLLDFVFRQNKKVIIVRAGKRSGKTMGCTNIARVFHKEVPGARGWIVSSLYSLTDMIFNPLWTSLTTSGAFGNIIDKSRKERRIRLEGGGLVEGKSWDDPDSLEGESLDYLLCDEAQTMDQERFDLLYARTVDRNGVFILIGSASSDDEWFLQLCDRAKTENRWGYVEWTIDDNPFQDVAFIEQAQMDLSEDSFQEMFYNKLRTPPRLVFKNEYDLRLNTFNKEPDSRWPLYVGIDPGTTAGAYAVAFLQIVPAREGNQIEEVRMFDEVYEHYTFSEEVLQEHVMKNQYWPRVVAGVMDTAGRQHHDKRDSPKDIWQAIGKIPIKDNKVPILMGIERMKTFLRQPNTGLRKLLIHERCVKMRMELLNYRYSRMDNPAQGAHKLPIDNFNHLIKAVTYFLVEHYQYFDNTTAGQGRPKGRLIT